MSDPKLTPFTIHTTPCKTVHGVPIPAHIPIPKSIAASPTTAATTYPVLVRFHSGLLVTGSALYTEWFPSWLVDFVLANRAILVMPDYRRLPEASGREVLEDRGWGTGGMSEFLSGVGEGWDEHGG